MLQAQEHSLRLFPWQNMRKFVLVDVFADGGLKLVFVPLFDSQDVVFRGVGIIPIDQLVAGDPPVGLQSYYQQGRWEVY